MSNHVLKIIKYYQYKSKGIACLSYDVPFYNGKIEKGVKIDKGASVGSRVTIGRHTYIGEYAKIGVATIGPFCSIAGHCAIGLGGHPASFISTHTFCHLKYRGFVDKDLFDPYEKGGAILGADVWLGFGAQVMAGVKIGIGAILASGAIATKDIPPFSIAAGVPAQVKSFRFDEKTRETILKSKWWEKDDDELKKIVSLFSSQDKFTAWAEKSTDTYRGL
ncbi:hypothetical protein JW926_17735 [Candidatus Sumerlaeota bacterium]|nr:hypothetical protein [Candidatus Sumerlaeota bacterium]